MPGAPVDMLRRVPLFSKLGRRELEEIAETMREREYAAGETVAREGRAGIGFFVIQDGRARVSVHGEDRGTLGPGDYFGEIALIDEGGRSATVTADTDLRCYGMATWEFRPIAQSSPELAWALVQGLAQRLRAAEQRPV